MLDHKARQRTRLVVLIVVLLVLHLPSVPTTMVRAASILFVAVDGSDANDCRSSERPCRTLVAETGKADDGATSRVGSGTYVENLVIHFWKLR
jgi:hypothetical protein